MKKGFGYAENDSGDSQFLILSNVSPVVDIIESPSSVPTRKVSISPLEIDMAV